MWLFWGGGKKPISFYEEQIMALSSKLNIKSQHADLVLVPFAINPLLGDPSPSNLAFIIFEDQKKSIIFFFY